MACQAGEPKSKECEVSGTGMSRCLEKCQCLCFKKGSCFYPNALNRVSLYIPIHCAIFVKAYYKLKESKDT